MPAKKKAWEMFERFFADTKCNAISNKNAFLAKGDPYFVVAAKLASVLYSTVEILTPAIFELPRVIGPKYKVLLD